jgi:soluble lytic murein transglycosylase
MTKSYKALLIMLWLTWWAPRGRAAVTSRELCVEWTKYYARVYHVPIELVEAVIDVESNWKPYAISSKGAVGLMQLMPGTAVRFGVWNRFDIPENIRGGVAYLAWLLRLFGGDLRLVVGAYITGEERIESRGLNYSSWETYDYVSRVALRYRARRLKAEGHEQRRGGA